MWALALGVSLKSGDKHKIHQKSWQSFAIFGWSTMGFWGFFPTFSELRLSIDQVKELGVWRFFGAGHLEYVEVKHMYQASACICININNMLCIYIFNVCIYNIYIFNMCIYIYIYLIYVYIYLICIYLIYIICTVCNIYIDMYNIYIYIYTYMYNRRKFRSQTSDTMDRWKAEMGRVREKRRVEERRSEKRKSQKKEDAGARKGSKR